MKTKSELIKMAKENPEIKEAILSLVKIAAEKTQFDESVPAVGVGNANQEDAAAGKQAAPVTPVGQPPFPQAPQVPVDANQQAMDMAGQGGMVDPSTEGAKAAREFLAPAFEAAAQGDINAQHTIAIAAGEIAKGIATAAHEATMGGQEMPAEAAPAVDANGQPLPPEAQVAPVQEVPQQVPAGQPTPEAAAVPAVAAVPTSPEAQAADQIVAQPAEAAPVAANADAATEEKGKKPGEEGGEKKPPFPPKKEDKKEEKKEPPKEAEKKASLMFSADDVKNLLKFSKAGII